ncbi:MAG: Hpt domain-containing protein [Beijerinckiaceae bacterium]
MSTAIDREELARQTFGEPDLAAEVLGMFADQAPVLLQTIAATAGQARADAAHRLKGSALAIGAKGLAAAAAALELAPADPDALAAVERACAAVTAEIASGKAMG